MNVAAMVVAVANRCRQLETTKNRMTGSRSNRNFMRDYTCPATGRRGSKWGQSNKLVRRHFVALPFPFNLTLTHLLTSSSFRDAELMQ